MSPFNRPPARVSTARLRVFASGMLLWAAIVVGTLHDLQIVRSASMRDYARRQHEQVIQVDPRRGSIFDRMGRELAVSTEVFSVYAAPEEIKEKDRDRAVGSLASAIGLPGSLIRQKLSGDGFVLLRRRAAPDVADRVRALGLPGIHLVSESKRFYPRGELASHVLGFVVPDDPRIREGLERKYDAEIRGTPGALVGLRDATGSHFLMEARRQPEAGRDLVTTLDEVIQHVAERELATAMEETGSRSGTVIVLHTPTGGILAIANQPTFNPNLYRLASPAERRNRAVTDFYEPGSTFKVITAAAALEEGLVRPSEIIDCQNGLIRVSGIPIRDHKSFGVLSFAEVIAESSDVGAIKVGTRLDARTFHDYITRFGFGSRTGVDLPGESRGLLRPASKWAATSEAYISFGQEIGATPLQIASAFSTVANRGVSVPPRVVMRVSGDGGREPERAASRRVIGEATAEILIDLLEGVVTEGTGKKAAVPGYRVAGKTGTAQKIVDGTYSLDKHVSSFAGFVPSRGPVLTIMVLLDEPRGAHFHGGDVAAPVFSRIASAALGYLGVPADAPPSEPVQLASLGAGQVVDPKPDSASGPAAVQSAALVTRRRAAKKGSDTDPNAPSGPRPVVPHPLDLTPPKNENQGAAEEGFRPADMSDPVVPDVSGAPLRDAVVTLARAGLACSVSGEGFVVTQEPPAGSPVLPGGRVSLTLGRWFEEIPAPTPSATKAGSSKDGSSSSTKTARRGAAAKTVAAGQAAGYALPTPRSGGRAANDR